jgi:hypothetical protein
MHTNTQVILLYTFGFLIQSCHHFSALIVDNDCFFPLSEAFFVGLSCKPAVGRVKISANSHRGCLVVALGNKLVTPLDTMIVP